MNKTNVAATRDTFHFLLDFLIAIAAYVIVLCAWQKRMQKEEVLLFTIVAGLEIILFLICNRTENVYNTTLFYYMDRIICRETKSFIIATAVTITVVFFLSPEAVKTTLLINYLLVYYGMIILEIFIFRKLVDKVVRRRCIPRTLYVGDRKEYERFRYFLQKTTILVNEIGFVSFGEKDAAFGYIGTVANLEKIIREYTIDQVYFLQNKGQDAEMIQKYVNLCIQMGITSRVIMSIYESGEAFSYISAIGTYPVLTFHTITLNNYERVIKRSLDVAGALLGIVITMPVMIFAAIAIKIDSPGPILLCQVRIGQNGRHFKTWKFRCEHSSGVTRVGRWIRILSIEELPQLFNVLSGSMSLVGTKPPTLDEIKKYETCQWKRVSTKPGIKGMEHQASSQRHLFRIFKMNL